ncbi:MAG: flexitail domain-containing putative surface protein [Dehalococcoidia bacterium]
MDVGSVECWGINASSTQASNTPSEVLAENGTPFTHIRQIAAGFMHACAVDAAGGVWCWGSNSLGELGDGSHGSSRPYAAPVVDTHGESLTDVRSVAASWDFTCALTGAGAVKCWGYNWFGALGVGGVTGPAYLSGQDDFRAHPQDVVGLGRPAVAVDTNGGGLHPCALLDDGTVKCWGLNGFGEVNGLAAPGQPDGSGYFSTPTGAPVKGNAVAVSAGGMHTCALLDNGAVTCWGMDWYGITGDSDGDGCTDFAEHGDNPMLGGLRNHEDYWDFFDTPIASGLRDGAITAGDIARVASRFGSSGDSSGDPLATPPAGGYHPAFDRGAQVGEYPWSRAPADGAITVSDIGAVVTQFGHSCA